MGKVIDFKKYVTEKQTSDISEQKDHEFSRMLFIGASNLFAMEIKELGYTLEEFTISNKDGIKHHFTLAPKR